MFVPYGSNPISRQKTWVFEPLTKQQITLANKPMAIPTVMHSVTGLTAGVTFFVMMGIMAALGIPPTTLMPWIIILLCTLIQPAGMETYRRIYANRAKYVRSLLEGSNGVPDWDIRIIELEAALSSMLAGNHDKREEARTLMNRFPDVVNAYLADDRLVEAKECFELSKEELSTEDRKTLHDLVVIPLADRTAQALYMLDEPRRLELAARQQQAELDDQDADQALEACQAGNSAVVAGLVKSVSDELA